MKLQALKKRLRRHSNNGRHEVPRIKTQSTIKGLLVVLSFLLVAISVLPAEAADYTSTNFILRDPVITIEGGRSTSSNFELFGAAGQLVTGEDTSTNFIHRGGFLYFSIATSPVLSATAGDSKVDLSWTAAVATLANITNYELGVGTSSGNYTFESVGNVTSFSKTGLTNGTTYYFIVRALAGTLILAKSGEVSATPSAPSPPPPLGGGGGGGGGGGFFAPATKVVFSGRAYPGSKVTLLKDAQIAASVLADPNAAFNISLSGLSDGSYIFAVYSEDSAGRRSSLLMYPTTISSGATIQVGGIFVAPTIAVDKSEVNRGENIAIFGQSAPKSDVTVAISSEEEFFGKTVADVSGAYLYNFDTIQLEKGRHLTKSKAAKDGAVSPFGKTVSFAVGEKTVFAKPPAKCPEKGDLNNDCRVNLIDFSIAAYWYKRPNPPANVDLNGDGKIDVVDFSIMSFYWTG